jgi:hypothetical protein
MTTAETHDTHDERRATPPPWRFKLDCRRCTTTWDLTGATYGCLAGVVCGRCGAADWSLVYAARV